MTNVTSLVTLMSSVGSPGTAMTSARKPGASCPRSWDRSTRSALVRVAACRACSGVMPRSHMAMSSSAWVPCGMAGASEPQAILTPAARALANIWRAFGKSSAAFFCRLGWMRWRAVWSAGVGGGPRQAVEVCLIDEGGPLLVGVLLRTGRRAEGHHAARGRDLDQLGPVLHLVADGLAHLGDAVGDARLHALRHDAGGQALEHGGIEVAARRSDGVTGREDARAGEPALVDRFGQVHVEQEAGRVDHQAQIAHRGEAGHERRVAV